MHKTPYLSVQTTKHKQGYRVYWCTDFQYGIISVATSNSIPAYREIVLAEISALHHLLKVTEVAGRDRTGEALAVKLSRGMIRKAIKHPKKEYECYLSHLHWFRTQFSDALLSVPKRSKADPHQIDRHLASGLDWGSRTMFLSESIDISTQPLKAPVYSTSIGDVVISIHAVKQFQKRNNMQSAGKSWRKVRNMIANEEMIPSSIDESVLDQKARKWRRSDAHYFNCARSWQLVFLPEKTHWTLATLYQRTDIRAT